MRAKTRCTFSLRARAGKASKSTIAAPEEAEVLICRKPRPRDQATTTSAAEAFSNLNEQTSSISELSQGLTSDILDPEEMGYGSCILQRKLDDPDFDGFTFDMYTTSEFTDGVDKGRDSFANQIPDNIDVGTFVENNMEVCSSMGDYAGENDASLDMFERAQIFTPSSSVGRGLSKRSSAPPLIIEHSDEKWTQKLSTLAVAFYPQLEKLDHGPWANNPLQSGHSMGGYPIGDDFQLSQELIGVLLRISWDAGRETVDITTALLGLNCYVSLVRTYSVVFAHLSQPPSSRIAAITRIYASPTT